MNEIRLSRSEARSVDEAAVKQLGIHSLVLMENAARGVCEQLMKDTPDDCRIVIVCGPGNNGGDGLALARQLAAIERTCEVYLVRAEKKQLTNDALANFDILQASGIEVIEVSMTQEFEAVGKTLTATDLIVDCLLGTGVRGAVRDPFAAMIESINQSAAQVLAVDVPSGFDCDTGEVVGGCVRADRTITFVARKRGFDNPDAWPMLGNVSVAHIGLPAQWVRTWLQRQE